MQDQKVQTDFIGFHSDVDVITVDSKAFLELLSQFVNV